MLKFRKPIFMLTKLAIIAVPLWYFLAAYGAKSGWWDFGHGMRIMSGKQANIVRYICMGLGVITLAMSLLLAPRKIIGVILGALALIVPIGATQYIDNMRIAANAYPPIHDVSTNASDAPIFSDAVMSLRRATEGRVNAVGDYMAKTTRDGGSVAELAAKGFPEAKTLLLRDDKDAAFDKALATAQSMGWEIVKADKAMGFIEATATTKWYGFKDDVVVRVRSVSTGSEVDLRSVSRIGGRDSGKNGLRVVAYLKKLGG